MVKAVSFIIPGEPQGKGRPRFVRVGNYVKTFTPDKTVSYEELIKLSYKTQCDNYRFEDNATLSVFILAYYGIPKSASKKKKQSMLDFITRPLKKVDADNLIKIVLDSLNGVAYKDDVQVVDCTVRKFYGEKPKVVVRISRAEPIQQEWYNYLKRFEILN